MRAATPDQVGRNILQTLDPLFSTLVVASILLHAGVALWLRMMAPAPAASLEEIEPERFLRLFEPAVPRPPPRMPAVAVRKPVAQKPELTPRSDVKPRVVNMGVLRVLKSASDSVAHVFGGSGPADELATQLREARSMTLDGPAVPSTRRVESPKDVGALAVRDLGPKPRSPASPLAERRKTPVAPEVTLQIPQTPCCLTNPDELMRAIRSRMPAIRACYERALKNAPLLKGKLVIQFVIGDGGRVQSVGVEEDSLGSEEVAQCVTSLIKRIRFPVPDEGTMEASFPFVFMPASQ